MEHVKGLMLQNDSCRVSMTLCHRISKSLVMVVCRGQKPWIRPLTHGNEKGHTAWHTMASNITGLSEKLLDGQERWWSEAAVLFFFGFKWIWGGLLGGCCRGNGQICRDREVSEIGVNDVKAPKNQKLFYIEKEKRTYEEDMWTSFHIAWIAFSRTMQDSHQGPCCLVEGGFLLAQQIKCVMCSTTGSYHEVLRGNRECLQSSIWY